MKAYILATRVDKTYCNFMKNEARIEINSFQKIEVYYSFSNGLEKKLQIFFFLFNQISFSIFSLNEYNSHYKLYKYYENWLQHAEVISDVKISDRFFRKILYQKKQKPLSKCKTFVRALILNSYTSDSVYHK